MESHSDGFYSHHGKSKQLRNNNNQQGELIKINSPVVRSTRNDDLEPKALILPTHPSALPHQGWIQTNLSQISSRWWLIKAVNWRSTCWQITQEFSMFHGTRYFLHWSMLQTFTVRLVSLTWQVSTITVYNRKYDKMCSWLYLLYWSVF